MDFISQLQAALGADVPKPIPVTLETVTPRPDDKYEYEVTMKYDTTVTVISDIYDPSYMYLAELARKEMVEDTVSPNDFQCEYASYEGEVNSSEQQEWDELYSEEYDNDGTPIEFGDDNDNDNDDDSYDL